MSTALAQRIDQQKAMLQNAIIVSVNTEEIGQSTLATLDGQRKQIDGMSVNLMKTDENISRSRFLLRAIKRNEMQIKCIMILIIVLLMLSIAIVIYVKMSTGSSSVPVPPNNGNITAFFPAP